MSNQTEWNFIFQEKVFCIKRLGSDLVERHYSPKTDGMNPIEGQGGR